MKGWGQFLSLPSKRLYTQIAAIPSATLRIFADKDEVASILPELVINRTRGNEETGASTTEPESVEYKLLSVLLLEELKKLKARVDVLEGV